MRILFLNAVGELGGAERSLIDILASLRRAQPTWPLHLIAGAPGPLVDAASSLGVNATVLPLGDTLSEFGEFGAAATRAGRLASIARLALLGLPVAGYVMRLRAAIRPLHADVIHTNNLKMHLLGGWAAPRRAAVIWHIHDYVGTRPLTARLLRWNARHATAIVANSHSVADDVRRALGVVAPVIPIHNGVDLQRFSVSGGRLDLDRLAGLPPAGNVVRVGLLGTFGIWKGHTTFLDAIARLPRDLNVRGYIVGGPLYQTAGSQHTVDYLRGYADALGLAGRVGFTGFVNNPEEAIRALDVVVHASTAPEPFGLVIAEAMACGRAVIASDAGGAREIYTPGIDALAHAPGDAESLAARLLDLVRDPAARARLGSAGRQTAERRFDRARLATDLLPVYQRALARS